MNWNNIKDKLPDKLSHPYDQADNDVTSLLVCGWNKYNFSPRYEIHSVNEVAEIKPNNDNQYIINNLMISHWQYIKSPLRK